MHKKRNIKLSIKTFNISGTKTSLIELGEYISWLYVKPNITYCSCEFKKGYVHLNLRYQCWEIHFGLKIQFLCKC